MKIYNGCEYWGDCFTCPAKDCIAPMRMIKADTGIQHGEDTEGAKYQRDYRKKKEKDEKNKLESKGIIEIYLQPCHPGLR